MSLYREIALAGVKDACEVEVSEIVPAPIGEVAALCCDFARLDQWHPAFSLCVMDGEGIGAVRIADMGGSPIRDRLEHAADDGTGYFYSTEETPLPVREMRGFIVATPEAEGATLVRWTVVFHPASDLMPTEALTKLVAGICRMGLSALRARLVARDRKG